MEIVYLYIRDYRRFKQQNINFGSEYVFHYDEKLKIFSIDNNNLYIDKFYNQNESKNISNVSAIIGENGTGKTGLIDYIIRIYSDGALFGSDEPFMFMMKKDNNFTLHYSSDLFEIENSEKIPKNIQLKPSKSRIEDNKSIGISVNHGYPHLNLSNSDFRTSILKISNILFGRSLNGFSNIFDFSNDGMISKYQTGEYFKEKRITDFYSLLRDENNENYIQLFKYLEVSGNKDIIPFQIPHLIKISSYNTQISVNNEKIKQEYEQNKSLLNTFYKIVEDRRPLFFMSDDLTKFNFINNVVSLVPIDLFNVIINDIEKRSVEIYYEIIKLTEDYLKNIRNNYEQLIDNIKLESELLDEKIKNCVNQLLVFYKEFIDRISEYIGKDNNSLGITQVYTLKFIEEILKSKNIHPTEFINSNIKSSSLYYSFDDFISSDLLKLYNNSYSFRPFLNFEFNVPLSSGQYAFLNIFSRIHNLFKVYAAKSNSNRNVENHILLLIDEIELYLHPNWQKNIVNTLSVFLNKIHPHYNFQIIFTANNPLPISDLLSYNTIFLSLDKCDNSTIVKDSLEDQKNTFAANIHTLLADSFFVKGGLIGDFSKDKINEIIQLFDKRGSLNSEEHIYIKKLIKQIGEPLIKNKLLQMYTQNNGLDFLERLERVEAKLESINDKSKPND